MIFLCLLIYLSVYPVPPRKKKNIGKNFITVSVKIDFSIFLGVIIFYAQCALNNKHNIVFFKKKTTRLLIDAINIRFIRIHRTSSSSRSTFTSTNGDTLSISNVLISCFLLQNTYLQIYKSIYLDKLISIYIHMIHMY